jgi:hypothetical protein
MAQFYSIDWDYHAAAPAKKNSINFERRKKKSHCAAASVVDVHFKRIFVRCDRGEEKKKNDQLI